MVKRNSLTFHEVVEEYVVPKIQLAVGMKLNELGVSSGQVHYSLGVMVVEDVVNQCNSFEEAAATLMSIQQFMYQSLHSLWEDKIAPAENKIEVN